MGAAMALSFSDPIAPKMLQQFPALHEYNNRPQPYGHNIFFIDSWSNMTNKWTKMVNIFLKC